ncbi:CPBP family intramembrane metalloprotease [Rhodopseudomonas sp. P2A-2r]|jgi:membrane protease YdiL (CAAX protease family)|uniref:CPBP family intramembrane glutamic endopeptidase n=1 Tax=Rhodopseudomonas sp. P2A-2r TaxID=2991972 RepID=UPI0022345A1C|nr:CPBP family intramembrane glutamic endopeptidase [Rhodopseudomonas sp. P2A-2r]UZE46646.1 CPBP family intramembrane metalloprotease [Rhodopseudomonas sp. P2A-2r]
MTFSRHGRSIAALTAFAVLLLAPGLAIHFGLLPFAYRTYALLAVSVLCIALCLLSGFSLAELGLSRPSFREHWVGCLVLTLGLAAVMLLQTHLFSFDAEPPVWLSFAPFYVLVSSPCQEVVCRSIPKLMTDRLQTRGWVYVLYSSAVFSLIHIAYGDPALLLNTFAVGIVWGIAYLRMLNIWPLILSHAAIGTLAFALGLA